MCFFVCSEKDELQSSFTVLLSPIKKNLKKIEEIEKGIKLTELLKVVHSAKFGVRNGSVGKIIVSYNINETNPDFKSLCLAVTSLKIQLLLEFRSDPDPPRALTLQVNKATSIKSWFSKALGQSVGE